MHAHKHVSVCKSFFFLVCTLTCALKKNMDAYIYISTYLLEVRMYTALLNNIAAGVQNHR